MLTKEHIIEILDDEDKVFEYFIQTPVQRSFVRRRKLAPETAEVLRETLSNGYIRRDVNRKGIRECYLNGWLHAEALDPDALNVVCVFPTRLHAKYSTSTPPCLFLLTWVDTSSITSPSQLFLFQSKNIPILKLWRKRL